MTSGQTLLSMASFGQSSQLLKSSICVVQTCQTLRNRAAPGRRGLCNQRCSRWPNDPVPRAETRHHRHLHTDADNGRSRGHRKWHQAARAERTDSRATEDRRSLLVEDGVPWDTKACGTGCLLCPVPILYEVFGGLQVVNRSNKRPRIPNVEEAKKTEGIVYGTPIKSPEDHHHQFATLVNPSPTSPELI